jgi:hypothetical protein
MAAGCFSWAAAWRLSPLFHGPAGHAVNSCCHLVRHPAARLLHRAVDASPAACACAVVLNATQHASAAMMAAALVVIASGHSQQLAAPISAWLQLYGATWLVGVSALYSRHMLARARGSLCWLANAACAGHYVYRALPLLAGYAGLRRFGGSDAAAARRPLCSPTCGPVCAGASQWLLLGARLPSLPA